MKIHQLTADEALRSLQSGPAGLSADQAARRLVEFGPNQFVRAPRESVVWQFIREFIHFFALILWLAAGLAFGAHWEDPDQGMATLGFAIVGVIIVNGVFSFWQVYRAERALAALEKLLPPQVKVQRGGVFLQIPAAGLVPGDVISLEAGDLIPADCRLIEGFGIRVNVATVTGESLPKARDTHPSSEETFLRSRNTLLAGTPLVSGNGRAVVCATGDHTEFGKIAHLTQAVRDVSFPLQREIAFLSRVVAILATALGLVFFLIGLTVPLSFTQNLLFAIGIIVALVPEGLLPTVTLALAIGAQRMARRNVVIRHLPAVETLGSATVICTDKTGTLTENRMHVRRLFVADDFQEVTDGAALKTLAERHPAFFAALRLCHNLKETGEHGERAFLGDPTEVALAEFAAGLSSGDLAFPRVDELPFDSDRRRMSTLHRTPAALQLYAKGALETLLPLCVEVDTDTDQRAMTPEWRSRLLKAQGTMAQDGLRVLAVACRRVDEGYDRDHLEETLMLTGLVGLDDPPRAEVPEAVRISRQAGIRVIMITGDHPQTATAVARRIGLVTSDTPTVITGDQLQWLSNIQLQLALDTPEVLFARIAADQKMRIVRVLQQKGEIVAVTGDGVNDAPALRQADIGIAMGVTGTDVARETADMVLMDDNFASIVAAVEEGRAVFDNIRKFLTYILSSNIPELIPFLAFVLFKIPLPLTIIQILAVDLGTDMLPALALGAELPSPQVMQRPPRARSQHLIHPGLLARAYGFLGMLEAVAAMAAFFYVLVSAGWSYGQPIAPHDPMFSVYLQATTACLSAIVVMQIVNVYLCRSARESVFVSSLWSNRLLLVGIGADLLLILAIDYTRWGNQLFGTAPIGLHVWLFIFPFAVGMLILEEVRKHFSRHFINWPHR
jgi:sodium/potassium-transporting ATPase subunit alpha